MKDINEKNGIIFDLDGTLWDSADRVVDTWRSVLEGEGYPCTVTRELLMTQMGKPVDEIVAFFMPEIPKAERDRLTELCCERENGALALHGGKLYPNVIETLENLSEKYPLYIVSNCQTGYIEAFFSGHGCARLFADTECWGKTLMPKGYNISLLAGRNNLKNAVYVGDTEGDYLAAKEAGAEFIFARYGFGDVPEARLMIDNFSELPSVVENFYSKRLDI